MSNSVKAAMHRLIQAYETKAKNTGQDFPKLEFDPEWISECQNARVDGDGLVGWWPVEQASPVDFRGLENALELEIHPDIKSYYGSYWSGSLEATCEEGHVSLIQLWNPQDFDRLVENLIGHALTKRRLKHPFSVFIATTDSDSEYFLSIDNESGEVLLEEPGCAPKKSVDENLATFLNRLKPVFEPSAIH